MKSSRKKLTNKEIEQRQNIMMSEIERVKHIVDTVFMTLAQYVEYKGDLDGLKEFMQNNDKEIKNV